MRSFNILVIAAAAMAITCLPACSKEGYDHCNETLKATATSDSMVIAGTTLNLSVTGIDNVYMYNWRGPNNFSAHGQSPQIYTVSSANAGKYFVDVITKDGCIYSANTDSVKIGSSKPPCSVPNNYAEFSNTFDVSFYSVSGATSGGSYFVNANGSGGDLEMEFSGTDRPGIGICNIQSLSGTWGPGNVRVHMTNNSALWYGGTGKVYVNPGSNGKLVVNFCSVQFSYQNFRSNVSLQVTVP
jgi:hypothetical protein